MTRAKRLKRVFGIDIPECEKCQGLVKIIVRIEDPIFINCSEDRLIIEAGLSIQEQLHYHEPLLFLSPASISYAISSAATYS